MNLLAEALLEQLEAAGVAVRVEGESLAIRPAEAVPQGLWPALRARKRELLELVSRRPLEQTILAVLELGEVHTTLSLALRLGRPRDPDLYAALGELLERGLIVTDPRTSTYRARRDDEA